MSEWLLVGMVALTWNFFGTVDKQEVKVSYPSQQECEAAADKIKNINTRSIAYCVQIR